MSALSEAIARSFSPPDAGGDDSPMRVLGRRQLSGYEVFAQSLATTAPAASMVIVPTMLLMHGGSVSGVLTLVAIVVATLLVAVCISQFTRRMVSPGGLYSFTFQGLGARGALLGGAAILLKYLTSASITLYLGSTAVVSVLGTFGVRSQGQALRLVVCAVIAAAMLAALIRGARVAAILILCIEACSLIFIVGLMVATGGSSDQPEVLASAAPNTLPFWLIAVFALAGFESATFLGSEARRPYVTVTRAVLWTPVVCGVLFVVAAWAALTGRANTIVEAYLYGASPGLGTATVAILHLSLAFSSLASAMASSNAASRILFTMGVDRVLPRTLAHVHARCRTPDVGLAIAVGFATSAALFMFAGGQATLPFLQTATRIAVITAYLVIAVACLLFLRTIGESTVAIRATSIGVTAVCLCALAALIAQQPTDREVDVFVTLAGLFGGATLWWMWLRHHTPRSLMTIGAFDRADSLEVLPGAAAYGRHPSGAMVLVADNRGPPR